VLFVKLKSPKKADPTVDLTVVFAENEAGQASADPADGEDWKDSALDVRVLFVYGEGSAGVTFDDLTIVDVAEETDKGHAPTVEVVALKRKLKELKIQAVPAVVWNTKQYRDGSAQYRKDELAAAQDQDSGGDGDGDGDNLAA
jgi:hypothetical protein